MMEIRFNLFPGGCKKALTMSYDDGTQHDIRLASIFNENGIKGTFHLNSARFQWEGFLTEDDVRTALKGHEVSCHSVHHPFLEKLPLPVAVQEVYEDRCALERLCGYPVRGMSYPFGTHSAQLATALRGVGMEYSRTTASTGWFGIPEDFMAWHPTCHHNENVLDKLDRFLGQEQWNDLPLLYVWGHSYEFHNDGTWDKIEEFCKRAGSHADVWYATNIEIVDYIAALKDLRLSADRTCAYNPRAMSVWVSVDGEAVELPGGKLTRLA